MENPKIRFKGFTKDWEQRKLNEVGVVIDPHPSHRAPKEEQGGIPFIGIGDVDEMGNINRESARPVPENVYDEHHKRYDLNVPSLGLGRVASLGKVIRLRSDIGKYAISPTISVLQFSENINIDYLYAYMNTPQFKKQFEGKSNGSTRQSVGTEMVRLLNLSIPFNLDEQKAIGTFYKNLDHLITLHQRKCEQTKKLKKYMLQKMFPQNGAKVPEIRFDGFTYDWEQRKLIDYLEVSSEKNRDNRFTKEDVLSVSGEYGIVNQIEFQGRSFAGASVSNYGVVENGDVVYTKSPLKSNPYGIIKTNKGIPGIVSTLYAVYKPKEITDSKFVQIYFELDSRMNSYMHPLVNKGAKNDMKVSAENALKGMVSFPKKDEQEMISLYFSTLDNLITLHQRKCDELKKMKKYMLQNMFI